MMPPDFTQIEDAALLRVAEYHNRQAAAYEYLASQLIAGRWPRPDRDSYLRTASDHRGAAEAIRRRAL